MKLVIVRHGAAVDRSAAVSEESRYLTPEGRVFFRKTARTMMKNGSEPGIIVTSPLVRAVQTADILAEVLSFSGPLVVREELRPGFGVAELHQLLDDYRTADELVLVGHEPDLSGIVAFLTTRPGGVNFRKGTAFRLKIDPANLPQSTVFKWLAAGNKLIAEQSEAFVS
ncbi:MAG TPA: histidine phosphatase family protein [Geobacteraceae bacterium]